MQGTDQRPFVYTGPSQDMARMWHWVVSAGSGEVITWSHLKHTSNGVGQTWRGSVTEFKANFQPA